MSKMHHRQLFIVGDGNYNIYLFYFVSIAYFIYIYLNSNCTQPFYSLYSFLQYEGKSKTISGRIRSATANVPIKRPVSNPAGSQSATTAPERAFSPTKFLVAGLVGGGQIFFPVSPSNLFDDGGW